MFDAVRLRVSVRAGDAFTLLLRRYPMLCGRDARH